MPDLFFYYLPRGLVEVGLLGGAQVDKYGNINSTVIGDYPHPKVRLPGSGGAAEIAQHAKEIMIITPMQKRRMPERLDFVTSAGFLGGGQERDRLNLGGHGPIVVVTDIGILRFDAVTHEMYLAALHPGMSVEQARANVGWELKVADELAATSPPTEHELSIIRELDPKGIFRT